MNNQLWLNDEEHILNKKDVLQQIVEYAKYLYEEEVKRAERFYNAVKTYLFFICSTFAGILGAVKWININLSGFFHHGLPMRDLVIGGIFGVSELITIVSFVLAILVIKTWRTERLCNPHEFYIKVLNSTDEKYVLQQILLNFLVAAEENAKVNDKKGKLLSLAAKTYYIGLLFLVLGVVVYVYT